MPHATPQAFVMGVQEAYKLDLESSNSWFNARGFEVWHSALKPLLFTSLMTLEKWFNFPEPQFPQ